MRTIKVTDNAYSSLLEGKERDGKSISERASDLILNTEINNPDIKDSKDTEFIPDVTQRLDRIEQGLLILTEKSVEKDKTQREQEGTSPGGNPPGDVKDEDVSPCCGADLIEIEEGIVQCEQCRAVYEYIVEGDELALKISNALERRKERIEEEEGEENDFGMLDKFSQHIGYGVITLIFIPLGLLLLLASVKYHFWKKEEANKGKGILGFMRKLALLEDEDKEEQEEK